MSEWFKEHDWKSCVRLKRTGGSNPLLCAKQKYPFRWGAFCLSREEIEGGFVFSEVRASSTARFALVNKFCSRGDATPCCLQQISSSLRQQTKHPFVGAFFVFHFSVCPHLSPKKATFLCIQISPFHVSLFSFS